MNVNSFGKWISKALLLVNPLNILSAANSGVLINGILNVFWLVSGVLIKPGDTTEIFTLCFLKSKYKLSVKFVKAALEGP